MSVPAGPTSSPPPIPYAAPAPASTRAPASLHSDPVLATEHVAQLIAARRLGARLRRATSIAMIDAWTTGIFGALTLIFSIGSIPGTLLGAGMVTLAILQSRSADRLRRLDERAPLALARNQVLLGILLFAYAAISLALFLQNPISLNTSAAAMDPQLAQMLAPYSDLLKALYITVYATVMAVAILGPGLTALYYYAQRKHILAYRTSTPSWILALQHAGVII